MRKLRYIFALLFILVSASAYSQSAKQPSKQDKTAWLKEMQQVKNEFISNSLNLNHDQKAKFIPLYNKMEKEVYKTMDEPYKMARQLKDKGDAATDAEYQQVADALFQCKSKEAAIEMKYYKEFKKILTPRQLVKLKKAERDFTKKLMTEHRKMKKDDKRNKRK